MEHFVREDSHDAQNSVRSIRLYHDNELLCEQLNEVLGSANRVMRLKLPGQEAVYEYDNGRVVRLTRRDMTEARGRTLTTSYAYNRNGLVESIDGPRTDVDDQVLLTYDGAGNLVERVNSLGHRHLFEYGDSDRPTVLTEPNGLRTQLDYDETGKLVRYVLADGSAQELWTNIIQNRRFETYVLDGPLGGRAAVTLRDQTETVPKTKVIGRRRPDGAVENTETVTRNGFGLPIVTREPNRGRVEYEYDEANNVVRETAELGTDIQNTYDELSRPIHVVRTDGGESEHILFRYDDCRNGIGRVCQIDRPDAIITFHYDDYARPERVDVRHKDSVVVKSYERDPVSGPAGSTYRIEEALGYAWVGTPNDQPNGPEGLRPRNALMKVPTASVLLNEEGTSRHASLRMDIRSRERRGEESGRRLRDFPGVESERTPQNDLTDGAVGGLGVIAVPPAAAATPDGPMVHAVFLRHCEGTPTQMPLHEAALSGYRSYWHYFGSVVLSPVLIANFYACWPIDEHTPTSPPDIRSTPPGTCTWGKWRQLQNDVDALCSASRCSFADDCDTFRQKVGDWARYVGARSRINNTCFMGGDSGHKRA